MYSKNYQHISLITFFSEVLILHSFFFVFLCLFGFQPLSFLFFVNLFQYFICHCFRSFFFFIDIIVIGVIIVVSCSSSFLLLFIVVHFHSFLFVSYMPLVLVPCIVLVCNFRIGLNWCGLKRKMKSPSYNPFTTQSLNVWTNSIKTLQTPTPYHLVLNPWHQKPQTQAETSWINRNPSQK